MEGMGFRPKIDKPGDNVVPLREPGEQTLRRKRTPRKSKAESEPATIHVLPTDPKQSLTVEGPPADLPTLAEIIDALPVVDGNNIPTTPTGHIKTYDDAVSKQQDKKKKVAARKRRVKRFAEASDTHLTKAVSGVTETKSEADVELPTPTSIHGPLSDEKMALRIAHHRETTKVDAEVAAAKAAAEEKLRPHREKIADLSEDFDPFTFDDQIPLGKISTCLENLHAAKAESEHGWMLFSASVADTRVHIRDGKEVECFLRQKENSNQRYLEITVGEKATTKDIARAFDSVALPLLAASKQDSTETDVVSPTITYDESREVAPTDNSLFGIVNRYLDRWFSRRSK